MKVGHLLTTEPWQKRLCGVSTYIRNMEPHLASIGLTPAWFWIEGEAAGGPGVPYQRRKRGWGEYRTIHLPNPALTRTLAAWLEAERPDVLHCHWAFLEALALLRDLPADSPPIVVSLHTFEALCPLKTHVTVRGTPCPSHVGTVCLREGCRSPRKWLMHDVAAQGLRRRYRGKASAWIAHNPELADQVRELGYPRVHALPLAVNAPSIAPLPHPRPPVLLFAGRLQPEKGLSVLARALPRMVEAVPGLQVRIAGDGPESTVLREADPRGAHIQLLGALDASDLQREYSRARLLVVPSLWKENFGMVGPEAMVLGTPAIASRVSGTGQWLREDVNGLGFDRDDSNGLADAAIRVLTDDALAARLGAGALVTGEELGMDKHVHDLRTIYEEATGE